METESYNRYQAKLLLDSRIFTFHRAKQVIKNLLQELKEQDEQIEELKKANRSFGETFDTLAPEVEKAIDQSRRHGAEKALHKLGVIPDKELEEHPPVKPLPSPDDEA